MAEYKSGDVFVFQMTDDEWVGGRVILDVKRQCIQPRLLKDHSPLASFNGAILIEVYRSISQSPAIEDTTSLLRYDSR